jgi:hypothetical protein
MRLQLPLTSRFGTRTLAGGFAFEDPDAPAEVQVEGA